MTSDRPAHTVGTAAMTTGDEPEPGSRTTQAAVAVPGRPEGVVQLEGGVGSLLTGFREHAFFPILSLLVAAVGWELVGRIAAFPFLPPFSSVVARLVELTRDGLIISSLGTSLANFAIAFAICIVVGVPVGIAMGVSKRIHDALDIYVNAFLTAPSLVFAPIFFAIFGLSRWAIISVIVTYALFIIIVSSEGAVKAVDPALAEMSRAYGASRRQFIREIVVPSSVPGIMAGLRLGSGRAVKGMINGEMFIAAVGLGALIINAGRRFDATTVLAVLLITVAVALLIGMFIQAIDRWLTSWLPETARP